MKRLMDLQGDDLLFFVICVLLATLTVVIISTLT